VRFNFFGNDIAKHSLKMEVIMSDQKQNENRDERNDEVMQSGWAGPGIEVWPEEDDYAMWRLMKKNERRHLECNIPALASSPFCGKGYHNG
jgi:hypothetical protein